MCIYIYIYFIAVMLVFEVNLLEKLLVGRTFGRRKVKPL